jgi:hypothetical protein
VIIKHIYIELMITNPLTKSIPPFKFKNHAVKMRLSSSCDFSCMKYIIFKKILFIVMFSHIYTHLNLFEKTRMYRKKNKHKVYLLSEVRLPHKK